MRNTLEEKRQLDETILSKQTSDNPYNTFEMGHLIYQVKIPLQDFSDCGKKHYHQGICTHLQVYDEGNPLDHPLNKKVVDIKDRKFHQAKSVRLTMGQILRLLNENRDEGFVKYDSNNWLDGLLEWTYLRLGEWEFYPMFFGAIELGHGVSQHEKQRAEEEKRMKNAYPFGKPDIVKQYIRDRRVCSCERHRRALERKGGYYA